MSEPTSIAYADRASDAERTPWRTPAGPTPWRWLAAAILPLAAAYLLMLNPYWVPSGDGEVYTAIARSLVKNQGLMFNGAKAAIAPPGWPIVLALAMKISPTFLFLKSITIAAMLGAMTLAFFTIRRFVSDRAAALSILLTGTLGSLYPLTFWMHTEAFFCLLGFGSLLIAFRLAERRARPDLEVPAMLLLLAMGAFTRWPGVLHVLLILPILFSGYRAPFRRPTRWLTALLVLLVGIGTFAATHQYLSLTPAQKQFARDVGGGNEPDGGDSMTGDPGTIETTTPTTIATTTTAVPGGDDSFVPTLDTLKDRPKDRSKAEEIAYRAFGAGRWFAWLLWQPTRFGQSIWPIDALGMVGGWLSIALLAVAAIRASARRNYFWLGLAAYTGGLCIFWPNPNARYFVPVAPFIVAGVLVGIGELRDWIAEGRGAVAETPPRGWAALAGVFVATVLLNNLPLLATDIWVFRSKDFYGRYEAGSNKELILAAQYINANPRPGAIYVSERYDNMGRAKWSKYGVRALHLLTGRQVLGVDRKAKLADRPTDPDVRAWLNRGVHDADYYVYQSDWKPWRVWHFRLSPKLQQMLTGRKAFAVEPSGGWELWGHPKSDSSAFRSFTVDPKAFVPPTRVPGL